MQHAWVQAVWPKSLVLNTEGTSTICQGFSISGAPLDRWWRTSLRTDLSSPSGAVSYFRADHHFRSCLLQPPQILSPITVRCLVFLFWHMWETHVSCLFSWQASRGRSHVHGGASADDLSAFQTAGFLLLTPRTRSSILLLKTVPREQCPLLSGHSFKPLFHFPSCAYTHEFPFRLPSCQS